MKQPLLLIIALALFTGCATTLPPAGPSASPMERADAIWIYTDDAPEDAYRKIAQLITDKGFTITSSDAVLMNISTEYKQLDESFGDFLAGSKVSVSINASVREQQQTAIKLTGKFKHSGQYGSSDNEVRNQGGRGSYTARGWELISSIASEYHGASLAYSRNQ